jgi:hypothetical protein
MSDHCPILVFPLALPQLKPKFQFESYLIDRDGYKECVKEAWDKTVPPTKNPLASLHIKLSRVAKALKCWAKSLASQSKVAMVVCREVIGQLEKAQESRHHSDLERNLINTLKARLLGLATIDKSRVRQRFRITWLRKGDENTKIFHLHSTLKKRPRAQMVSLVFSSQVAGKSIKKNSY